MRFMADIGYQNESRFLDLYQIRDKWVPAFINQQVLGRYDNDPTCREYECFLAQFPNEED